MGPRPSLTGPVEAFGRAMELALTTLIAPIVAVGPWLARPAGRWFRDTAPPAPAAPPARGRHTAVETPADATADTDHRTDTDTDGGGPGPESPADEPGRPDRWRRIWPVAWVYVLAVVAWALLTVLRRVDTALQQMAVGDQRPGGGLGFAVPLGDVWAALTADAQLSVDATRAAWKGYETEVAATTVLHTPFTIAGQLVVLDACFVLVYGLLLLSILVALARWNAATPENEQRKRRAHMVRGAIGALGLLVVVDLLEDWQLDRSVVHDDPLARLPLDIALGPLMSLLKWPLTGGVLVPIIFVAIVLAARVGPLRRALASVRAALYAVGALVLVLTVGIGAAQADDVIRAWDLPRAAAAVAACAALSLTVAGVARHLSGRALEHPAPDVGRSAQPLLLGTAVLLILLGQALRVVGYGWGLSAAGAVLSVLWLLGALIDDPQKWPGSADEDGAQRDRRRRRQAGAAVAGLVLGVVLTRLLGGVAVLGALLGAFTGLVMLAAWSMAKHPDTSDPAHPKPVAATGAVTAAEDPEERDVAVWGDRLGRLAGAVVAATVVVTVARATALDAYVREDPAPVVRWPLIGAVGAGVVGLAACVYSSTRARRLRASLWPWLTLVVLGCALLLLRDANAVGWPQNVGTVCVVLGGFTLVTGALAIFAAIVRRGPMTRYALIPALRALRFTRFPVVGFLLAWVLVVSLIDPGGYHDIRRTAIAPDSVPPTLGQAWQQYLDAVPPGGSRPVVLVAAQGGGIRAAVWTTLVMECIFGPGPVRGSGYVCAHGGSEPDVARMAVEAARPSPVFLASGASGGSVGLAAWSARRTDLVQDSAAGTPRVIEEALQRDYVAPDVARLLVADLPHAVLAWDHPDRAAMLERAWEGPWAPGRGLSRGLRRTWDITHDGAWGTPVLAFNGVSVEDDCRFVVSAVDFTLPRDTGGQVTSADDRPHDAACRGVGGRDGAAGDILPATNELIDYLCPGEDVPMSTAAHLSARFPYVSPTGRIERRRCPDEVGPVPTGSPGLVPRPALSYDADGGLFDNSGAGTAVDTWRALAQTAATDERSRKTCLVPLFLQIDNSPPSATGSSVADARPDELFAPVDATMNQISSRDRYARASAAAAFTRMVSADGRRVTVGGSTDALPWFRIALYGQPGPEPPLGWTLSRQTIDDMRSQLNATPNATQIRALREALRPESLAC